MVGAELYQLINANQVSSRLPLSGLKDRTRSILTEPSPIGGHQPSEQCTSSIKSILGFVWSAHCDTKCYVILGIPKTRTKQFIQVKENERETGSLLRNSS